MWPFPFQFFRLAVDEIHSELAGYSEEVTVGGRLMLVDEVGTDSVEQDW